MIRRKTAKIKKETRRHRRRKPNDKVYYFY
jgi:hypothetical protein